MKLTLSWLKDHLETSAPLDTIAETLTKIGLEVEGIDDAAAKLSGFTIAHVIEAKQHPNADKLRVCMVDTGAGAPVQVVCGAPNARTGMKSVFSPPGTFIPGKNITLGKGVIRGVESNGMLCSEAELELSQDHDGIIDLPADAPVGMRYADWAKLGEAVIDINLTPNRPDAAGIYGIARDLAAAGLGMLQPGSVEPVKGSFACPVGVTLAFPAGKDHLCPEFALRLVRGVKNGPSPDWLQQRLKSIGLRPINALVDITNFITFDRGRPLHVFDAKKVKGDLVVREAKAGEELLGLDGRTHRFEAGVVVIADENGIESIGGIMGGEQSGCDEATTDVLIESALWDPLTTARTGRALGINTDARYRFERGVDPAFNRAGLELATQMVLDLCGGTPSDVVVAGGAVIETRKIAFPVAEVKRLTGLVIDDAESLSILSRLGFGVHGKGPVVDVELPSWRPDVEGKADLVEEVIRIAGLERVQHQPLERLDAISKAVLTPLQKRTRVAKRLLASRGFVEAVTWSFISDAAAKAFGGGQPELKLANPIAADLSDMRPSLLPGLLSASQRNADRGIADLALFEVGQIFRGAKPGDQKIAATGVRRGLAASRGTGRHWSAPEAMQAASVHDAKADAVALLACLGIAVERMQVVPGGPAWLHPGRSAVLQFGPKDVLGYFGEMHPKVLQALGIDEPVMAFEIILDALPQARAKATKVKPQLIVSDLQAVRRDFAFLVARSVRAEEVIKIARNADKALIKEVVVFDVYEGKGVPEDKKSIALGVTLQPTEKTLTEADIDALSSKLITEIGAKTGATLR
jgi:phenylalanyl-tRNA synthetase beta chain